MKKKRNAQPEALLQMRVRRMLLIRAPADLFWIGGASGIRLTPYMTMKAKAQGVTRRGWPDLTFMYGGESFFVELKKDAKAPLSDEQADFRDACGRLDNYAVCWSVEGVECALTAWGIALKPEGVDMSAYLDGKSFSEAFE